MIKALITALAIVLFTAIAWADPHLTADPQIGVVGYECTFDTVPPFVSISSAIPNSDGTVYLWQDMASWNPGLYTVTCVADYGGIWGKSAPSLPFSFVKPDLVAPSVIRLE